MGEVHGWLRPAELSPMAEGRKEREGLAGDPKVDGRVDIHAMCMHIRAAAYKAAA
jgi:hypothetical protein